MQSTAQRDPSGPQPHPIPLVSGADLVNPLLRVRDVMIRDIPTCAPEMAVRVCAWLLHDRQASAVAVVISGKPVGAVTTSTLIRALADQLRNMDELKAAEIAVRDFPTVNVDATLEQLFDCFGEEGVFVVDREERLAGMVRWQELLGHMSERGLGRLIASVLERRQHKSERRHG